ncbi:MAG: prolyl oligopeptidase family serine peptidase [Pirellulales bacterium]
MLKLYFALSLAVLSATSAFGQDAVSFTLDQGLRLRQFADRSCCDLSPDGKLIAVGMKSREHYAVSPGGYTATGVFEEANGGEIWLCDTDLRTTRRLTAEGEAAWSPSWSPDGTKLAYYSDLHGKPQLHIWNRSTEQTSTATGRLVRTYFLIQHPKWSSDSRYVYLHALAVDHEANFRRANLSWPWQAIPFVPYQTQADLEHDVGRQIVTLHKTPLVANQSQDAAPATQISDGQGIIDLLRFDTQTGEYATLVKNTAIVDFELSPDNKWIVVSVILGEDGLGTMQIVFRLLLVPTDPQHGSQRVLVDQMFESWGSSMSWSPDSTQIAFLTSGQLAGGDLMLVDVASGQIRNLTQEFAPKLTQVEDFTRPIWSSDGQSMVLSSSGDLWRFTLGGAEPENLTGDFEHEIQGLIIERETTVLPDNQNPVVLCQFRNAQTLEQGFCQVHVTDRSTKIVYQELLKYPSEPRLHVDTVPTAGMMVYRAASRENPTLLRVVDLDFSQVETMPSPNEWLKEVDLGRVELLNWKLDDGTAARGILLLPTQASPTDRPACVVIVYPGSKPSESVNEFGLGEDESVNNPRFFLARGFAVFLPDLPMGEDPEPMQRIYHDTESALSALEDSQHVDMQRLGIFGHSYGGYAVNSIIVQTNRFRAAVSSTGASNLTSAFFRVAANEGNTGWFESGQGRMQNTVWDDPQRFVRNSPVFHLRRVQTPLLLLHGQRDSFPGPDQSTEMFGGLRRLGKTAEMAIYPEAGHWYGSNWSEPQLRDFWDRVLNWFERYLQP